MVLTQAAYFNVHGQPLALSAKDAVIAREPTSYAKQTSVLRYSTGREEPYWEIFKARADGKQRLSDRRIGDGANEESAWRNTLSRMRIEDAEADPK